MSRSLSAVLLTILTTGLAADEDPRSHWSFQSVRRPELPAVRDASWVRSPVDRFVLAKLEEADLSPSAAVEREGLIRRVALDLTGLLPSPEEVDAFLADRRPDAYDRLVDRYLASPHYGERWGQHWLDLARYADSNGFTNDSPRSIWLYRDWVIDALNRNLSFDQFTIEQLAGDLLPGATESQRVATGFHRNTLVNEEGGADREQFRIEAVYDRVDTTGTVWLGLTVACARCHSHKFDPLTQQEYFGLFAFFNDCDEPRIQIPDAALRPEYETVLASVRTARKRVQDLDVTAPLRCCMHPHWRMPRDWLETRAGQPRIPPPSRGV